jgi:hypothetical protein
MPSGQHQHRRRRPPVRRRRYGRAPSTILTPAQRRLVERGVAHVVTRDLDGTRHSTPRASLVPWDGDRLAFVEIHDGRTLANLRRSPTVEVDVVDPLRGRGHRFSGQARVVTDGLLFEIVCKHEVEPAFQRFVEAVVLVDVRSVSPLVAPVRQQADDTVLHLLGA